MISREERDRVNRETFLRLCADDPAEEEVMVESNVVSSLAEMLAPYISPAPIVDSESVLVDLSVGAWQEEGVAHQSESVCESDEVNALFDDGFLIETPGVCKRVGGFRTKLQLLAESQVVYYCGELVVEVEIPAHGAEHVMPDVLERSTFPGHEFKRRRSHSRTSHVYGFVDGVTCYDVVVFRIRCSDDMTSKYFAYDSENSSICRVESSGVAWLRKLATGGCVNLSEGVRVNLPGPPLSFVDKPTSSCLALIDGVFHYIPDYHVVGLRVYDGKFVTRDGLDVGVSDWPDGYYRVDARRKTKVEGPSIAYATTKSHVLMMQRAAIMSDLVPYLGAEPPQKIEVCFRRDADYNTFQHPYNYSLVMLERVVKTCVSEVVKTYYDLVALALGSVQDGAVMSYRELVEWIRKYNARFKCYEKTYKVCPIYLKRGVPVVKCYNLKFVGIPLEVTIALPRACYHTLLTRLLWSARLRN